MMTIALYCCSFDDYYACLRCIIKTMVYSMKQTRIIETMVYSMKQTRIIETMVYSMKQTRIEKIVFFRCFSSEKLIALNYMFTSLFFFVFFTIFFMKGL